MGTCRRRQGSNVRLLASASALAFGFWVPAAVLQAQIVDSPTASAMNHGELRWEIGVGPGGSVLTSLRVGAFERLQFGIAYGMQEVLGRGEVGLNPHPGIHLHLLAVDDLGLPAIAIGFDSQGRGPWLEELERYERKSNGFYAVATQNFAAGVWNVMSSVSGGINFSLEERRESFDLFCGAQQKYGRNLTLLLDYDLGLDDRSGIDANYGYLDFGIQWSFGRGNNVRLLLRDLMGNYNGVGQVARELNFLYMFNL